MRLYSVTVKSTGPRKRHLTSETNVNMHLFSDMAASSSNSRNLSLLYNEMGILTVFTTSLGDCEDSKRQRKQGLCLSHSKCAQRKKKKEEREKRKRNPQLLEGNHPVMY